MNDITKLRYWCYKILPLAYDDSLSYYEVLAKICAKTNELIDNVNLIPDEIASQIKGVITGNQFATYVFKTFADALATNEGSATNTLIAKQGGEVLWLNDTLYEVVTPMPAGTLYIPGTNIIPIKIADWIEKVKTYITNNNEHYSETSNHDYDNYDMLYWKDDLYIATHPIKTGDTLNSNNLKNTTVGDQLSKVVQVVTPIESPKDSDITTLLNGGDYLISRPYKINGECSAHSLIFTKEGKLTLSDSAYLKCAKISNPTNKAIFNINTDLNQKYTNRFPLLLNEAYPEWFGGAINQPIDTVDHINNNVNMGPFIEQAFRAVAGQWGTSGTKISNNHNGNVKLDGSYFCTTPVNIGGLVGGNLYGPSGVNFLGEGTGSTFLVFLCNDKQDYAFGINFGSGQQKLFSNFTLNTLTTEGGTIGYSHDWNSGFFLNSCDSLMLENIWVSGFQKTEDDNAFLFNSCLNVLATNLQVEHTSNAVRNYSSELKIANLDCYSCKIAVLRTKAPFGWVAPNTITNDTSITNVHAYDCQNSMIYSETGGKINVANINTGGTLTLDHLIYNTASNLRINISNLSSPEGLYEMIETTAGSSADINIENSIINMGTITGFLYSLSGTDNLTIANTVLSVASISGFIYNTCNVNISNTTFKGTCSTARGTPIIAAETANPVNININNLNAIDGVLVTGSPGTPYLIYSPNNQAVTYVKGLHTGTHTINLRSATSGTVHSDLDYLDQFKVNETQIAETSETSGTTTVTVPEGYIINSAYISSYNSTYRFYLNSINRINGTIYWSKDEGTTGASIVTTFIKQ